MGWQETSQKDAPKLIAVAEHKGTLGWSANLKTYAIALAAPVRNGYDGKFEEWRAVMTFPVCLSCSG